MVVVVDTVYSLMVYGGCHCYSFLTDGGGGGHCYSFPIDGGWWPLLLLLSH